MNLRILLVFTVVLSLSLPTLCFAQKAAKLPPPKTKVGLSVEEALKMRKSTKSYLSRPVGKEKLAQVLWATAGVNRPKEGKRTHPSAMAKYTVDLFVCDGTGIYKYLPKEHQLERVPSAAKFKTGPRKLLPKKDYVKKAPILLILVGDVTRLPSKFPENLRWNWIYCEAGAMCQNLHLQCAALGLGTCVNAGFDGEMAKKMLALKKGAKVLFVLPLGYPE